MLIKPILPFVETMITQACNISCVGCTNYSDLRHNGYVSWKDGKKQIQDWLERVDILDFGIMGGEPLINPEVREWIQGCRDILPTSQIRFTTNGLLLHKHLDVIDLLSDIGNCVFKITVHQNDKILNEIVREIYSRFKWESVVEYGITRHKTKNNFRFQVKRPDLFLKTYKNSYHDMMPWNSIPSEAFSNCCQQTCPLLYNGAIYKCSTAGLLADTLKRFNNPNLEQWLPYIAEGISPDCAEEILLDFISNFGNPNVICGQCPSVHHAGSTILHIDNVSRKKYL